jgi:DKNYY family
MKLSIITIIILCSILCHGQKKFDKNGIVYTQLKHDIYKDSIGNIYLAYSCPDEIKQGLLCFKQTMPLLDWEKQDTLKNFIDVKTYQTFLNCPFSKDKKYVYYKISNSDGDIMRIIVGADAKTFRVKKHTEYEAEDNKVNYVFKNYSLETTLKNMKYTPIGKGFYKGDNNQMYILTNAIHHQAKKDKNSKPFYRKIPFIDLETYQKYEQNLGYSKDKNHVYWRRATTDGEFIDIVQDANPSTFKIDSLYQMK